MDDNELSYEPMDVDMSTHSANEMDISYTGCTENKTKSFIDISIVKTEPLEANDIIDIIDEKSDRNIYSNPNILVLSNIQRCSTLSKKTNFTHYHVLLLSLTFLVISIFAYQFSNFTCNEGLNIKFVKHNLMTKLYGQAAAAESIINALESTDKRKMLIFYGSTGVGKTYSISLILENILDHKNIYHFIMPSFLETFSSDLMLGLLFCKSAILVVDDLKKYDTINIKPLIKELIIKIEKLSKKINIILVYNCVTMSEDFVRDCDESFYSELKQSLEDVNITTFFIKFESLNQEHLRNCIKDELGDKKINAKDIDNFVNKFDVKLDGCKGVHQKMQYMNIL